MADWTQRELCPDGACIGVIGSTGTCNVCGKAGTKRPAAEAEPTSANADDDDDDDDDDEEDDESADYEDGDDDDDDDDDDDEDGDDEDSDDADDDDEGEAEADEDGSVTAAATPESGKGEWTARKLCPDGACIGVIGADGTCKVCGRSAA